MSRRAIFRKVRRRLGFDLYLSVVGTKEGEGWLLSRRHISVTPCMFHMPGIKRALKRFNDASKWQIAQVLPCECRRFTTPKCYSLSFTYSWRGPFFCQRIFHSTSNAVQGERVPRLGGGGWRWNNETIYFLFMKEGMEDKELTGENMACSFLPLLF